MTDIWEGLPRRLRVGQYAFKVVFLATDDHPKLEGSPARTVMGLDEYTIYLHRGMTWQRAAEVVLHEVQHAVNWVRDITDRSKEEEFVTENAAGLTEVFIHNPKFHDWHCREIRRLRRKGRAA